MLLRLISISNPVPDSYELHCVGRNGGGFIMKHEGTARRSIIRVRIEVFTS
jgi:hypothetical protein